MIEYVLILLNWFNLWDKYDVLNNLLNIVNFGMYFIVWFNYGGWSIVEIVWSV